LLALDARGSSRRREGWFERTGRKRIFGKPIGPSGAAAFTAVALFLLATLSAWLLSLERAGRLVWYLASSANSQQTQLAPSISKPEPQSIRRTANPQSLIPRGTSKNELLSVKRKIDQPATEAVRARKRFDENLSKTAMPLESPAKLSEPEHRIAPVLADPALNARDAAPVLSPASPPSIDPPKQRRPLAIQDPTSVPIETLDGSPSTSIPPVSFPPALPVHKSGMLIWSGQLEKGGTLNISGEQPSSGRLRGDPLPGVPVFLTVEPRDIVVSNVPASLEGYRRFALRSPSRRNIVIKIHWETMP